MPVLGDTGRLPPRQASETHPTFTDWIRIMSIPLRILASIAVGLFGLSSLRSASAQMEFEAAPISYETAEVNTRITRLQAKIDSGEVELKSDGPRGYLASVLKLLEVPQQSQVLVFSKTSLQLRRITPDRPRAIYFNEDTYIGYCQQGDVLEVATQDAQQGTIFYTLDQSPPESPNMKPTFLRDRGQCLTCHASSRTQGVPGLLVRSVFSDGGGHPLLGSGTFSTDHTSPFSKRWGGWYVSGQHGSMRHMGNVLTQRKSPETLDRESGANATDLSKFVSVKHYLTPHSDLVALMVLEHQVQMHNFITLANFETRSALHHDDVMNKALERPDNSRSELTDRRIHGVTEKLVRYLLFSKEYALESPVSGTSGFAEEFQARGPRDSKGRSLRDLDIQTRLLKYPCSYLIYSEEFAQLPVEAKTDVLKQLREVLTGKNTSSEFAHLKSEDRQAIYEILEETLPGLPADW